MKKSKLALAIATLLVSGIASAAPGDVIQNTLGGVAGYDASVTSSNTGASGNNTASIGSAAAPADITGGISNSIGISSVGSSASVSTSTITNAPETNVSNIVQVGSISSSNDAVISNGAVDAPNTITGGSIDGGISNSISISAIGSSGSLSTKTIMDAPLGRHDEPGSITNAVGGNLGVGGVTISSTNTGEINNNAAIVGSDIAAPGISGDSISGSIGVSAVGSSASASNTTIASGGVSSTIVNNVNVASIDSTNSGNVANVGAIDGGSISGGIGNSVSVSAIGSAASMSNNITIVQ